MSEFAHTVRDNMPLVDNYSGNVFHEDTVQALHDVYDPLMDSFSRLNKEHQKERAGKRDVLQVMWALLEEDDDFDEMIDSLYESAAAMYLLAVQTKVIRALFRNPDMYAAKCETPDGSHLSFQNLRSIPRCRCLLQMPLSLLEVRHHVGVDAIWQMSCGTWISNQHRQQGRFHVRRPVVVEQVVHKSATLLDLYKRRRIILRICDHHHLEGVGNSEGWVPGELQRMPHQEGQRGQERVDHSMKTTRTRCQLCHSPRHPHHDSDKSRAV